MSELSSKASLLIIMSSTPQISVVIPTHDRPEALKCVLGGLATQTFEYSFEVIVIQDGANSQTSQLLQALRPPFALTHSVQTNTGPSSARNRGVRLAKAPVILFLDDDIVPVPGLLTAHLKSHLASERVGVIGSVQLHPSSPFLFLAEATDWSEAHVRRCSAPGYKVEPQDVPGGNFSVRRVDLDRVGGWNEQMPGGGEDRELAVRLVYSGVQLTFATGAVGQHYYCKDWVSYLQDMYSAGPAGIRFYQSHPERLYDIPAAKWLSASFCRRNLYRVVRYIPDSLFRLTIASFAPLLRRFNPRHFRQSAGAAARLTGLLWYARGFWNQNEQADAFAHAVETTKPIVPETLMRAHASSREK
jgi:glycosyltransferase involved in cell wall biosynthesis